MTHPLSFFLILFLLDDNSKEIKLLYIFQWQIFTYSNAHFNITSRSVVDKLPVQTFEFNAFSGGYVSKLCGSMHRLKFGEYETLYHSLIFNSRVSAPKSETHPVYKCYGIL